MSERKNETTKSVTLNVIDEQYSFRWQMFFNTFTTELVANGCIVRLAYVHKGTAAEIVPIIVSSEGLRQLSETSEKYIQTFKSATPSSLPELPAVRQFSPLFANHARLARSGSTAEIALFTVPLHTIASAMRGKISSSVGIHAIPVAILHSDIEVHESLVLSLLSRLPEQ